MLSSMKLLILGGTAMLGKSIATQALAAGHEITCVARGGRPAPEGVTFVAADRDEPDALAPVADEHWDAVIDVTVQPGRIRRAVRELTTDHWVYVSSASAYSVLDQLEMDESAPLHAPLVDDVFVNMEDYGATKVACEQAVQQGAASWTIVRPALIGGRDDISARSGYYAWRFAHPTGPDVLVPSDLSLPTAVIDVDDLAAFVLLVAERKLQGNFNVAGKTVTLGEFIETSRAVAGPDAPPARSVPLEVLREQGVGEWMGPKSLPLWIDDPAERYSSTLGTAAARAAGLTIRPLEETLAAALAFEETRTTPRYAGLTDEEEIALREALS